MDNFIFFDNEVIATDAQNNIILDDNGNYIVLAVIVKLYGKHEGKFSVINCVGLSHSEIKKAKSDALYLSVIGSTFTNFLFAERYAEMILRNMFNNELCALEAFADAANAILHVEIAAVAEADAMQYEASEIAAENDGIDFVQVYIDGLPNDFITNELMQDLTGEYIKEFLDDDLDINERVEINGETLYLEETILDTCFCHGGGVWEFWANPAHPDEKSLLMIYLRTTPVKARKKPRYPQETDYLDYANGGDGYTSENLVLDF